LQPHYTSSIGGKSASVVLKSNNQHCLMMQKYTFSRCLTSRKNRSQLLDQVLQNPKLWADGLRTLARKHTRRTIDKSSFVLRGDLAVPPAEELYTAIYGLSSISLTMSLRTQSAGCVTFVGVIRTSSWRCNATASISARESSAAERPSAGLISRHTSQQPCNGCCATSCT
jgi:hypothetical protein